MKNIQDDDGIPGLLRRWQVNPTRSPGFSTGVWRRIEERRKGEAWISLARAHPATLAVLMVAAVAAGGWGGAESARARLEHQSAIMADAYVQSMDARQMEMP